MSSSRYEIYLNKKAMGKSLKRIYLIRDSKTKKVRWHNSNILLKDVELIVQESGYRDTLKRLANKSKVTRTVHAFLRGIVVNRGRNATGKAQELGITLGSAKPVGYDPLKTNHWVELSNYQMPTSSEVEDLPMIKAAKYALLHQDGILVLQ